MSLKIYNSLSQSKELFEPVQPGKVGIYLCGPTVYKPSHIGHAVGPIIFDTVKRYLTFKGFTVTWVVNITDVDDKLIDEARQQGLGVRELAESVTKNYVEAIDKLGVRGIDHMPRASEHIAGIIEMCERLISKGAAYVSGQDVYFDVSQDPDYGKLSHRKAQEQVAGSRELTGGEKRNPGDFALWKAAKPEEPDEVKFDSPWGQGRPGWHIECSVMSSKLLGMTFDIHGGGQDLMFPHHENEIAQSETCNDAPFAKYWMHNGLTRFKTKKISKSDVEMAKRMDDLLLGNLLAKHSAELLRFVILSTHYRRPIDFSDEELEAKKKGLETFYRLFDRVQRISSQDPYQGGPDVDQVHAAAEGDVERRLIDLGLQYKLRFLECMDDDFNTGGAVGVMFELANGLNRFMDEQRIEAGQNPRMVALVGAVAQTLRWMGALLGIFEHRQADARQDQGFAAQLMDVLIAVRARARADKQFAIADLIRDQLAAIRVRVEDGPDGTIWRHEV